MNQLHNKLIFLVLILSILAIAGCADLNDGSYTLSSSNGIDAILKTAKTTIIVDRNQFQTEPLRVSYDLINSGEFFVSNGRIVISDNLDPRYGGNSLEDYFSINSAYDDEKGVLRPLIIENKILNQEFYYEFGDNNLLRNDPLNIYITAAATYEVNLPNILVENVCAQKGNDNKCSDFQTFTDKDIKNNRAPLMLTKIEKEFGLASEGLSKVRFNFYFTKSNQGSVVNNIEGHRDFDGALVEFIPKFGGRELECTSGLNYFNGIFTWSNNKDERSGVLRCSVDLDTGLSSESIFDNLEISMSYYYQSTSSTSVKFISEE